jgi:hypothetical protein
MARHLRIALVQIVRAATERNRAALATVNETFQPLVDAFMGWVSHFETCLDGAMTAIIRMGHTSHCAHRLAFGDGECECGLKLQHLAPDERERRYEELMEEARAQVLGDRRRARCAVSPTGEVPASCELDDEGEDCDACAVEREAVSVVDRSDNDLGRVAFEYYNGTEWVPVVGDKR